MRTRNTDRLVVATNTAASHPLGEVERDWPERAMDVRWAAFAGSSQPVRGVRPMLRQIWTVVLVALTSLGSLTIATAQQSKEAGGKKQITNSIGMKLVLIPAGEFMMGSGESAEDTAAFFNRTYGEDLLKADFFKDEHPQHRVRITQAVLPGHVPCHAGPVSAVRQGHGLQDRRGEGREAGGLRLEPGQEEVQVQREVFLAERGFRADRRAPGGERKLERRGGLLQVAQPQGRQDLPAADGGRVGICLPCRDDNAVLQRRRSRDAGQGRQRGRRHGQGEVPGLEIHDQSQRRLCVHGAGGFIPAQCLRALRHARKCLAVVRGSVRHRTTTPHPPQTTQPARTPEISVSFGAVPGSTGRTAPVPPVASGPRRTTGTATRGSVLPGLRNVLEFWLIRVSTPTNG